MCGITGYIGYKNADKVLFDCLKRLEYRGYDSCGIALVQSDGIKVIKDTCRVKELEAKHKKINSKIGIGHTRWATCGEPTAANAHPHSSCGDKVAVVHNGTLDQFIPLKEDLISKGHVFKSETDTEIIPHLIEENMKTMSADDAVKKALGTIQGAFAVAAIVQNENKLYVGKVGCPLVIGVGDSECYVASDSSALSKYTNRFIYLKDHDTAVLTPDSIKLFRNGKETEPEIELLDKNLNDAELHGYPHFMLKEIHEEPRVITTTIDDLDDLTTLLAMVDKDLGGIRMIKTLACGSSYYASLMMRYLAPQILGIPTFAELGSEYCSLTKGQKGTLAIAISQSGETADTIKAAKAAKANGYKLMAITNVKNSQLARAADYVWTTKAGPEVSVAATKTVLSQIAALYSLILAHPSLSKLNKEDAMDTFRKLPDQINKIFENVDSIISVASYLADFKDAIYIARGLNYPIALEGALKLKEISYIHGEGYAAGELKHGPFALLGKEVPVIAIVSHDENYDSLVTNLREVKTRQAPLIAISEENDLTISNLADYVITVPHTKPILSPILNLVVVQLLAYYTAVKKGNPVDFPRNLAKTVTVE